MKTFKGLSTGLKPDRFCLDSGASGVTSVDDERHNVDARALANTTHAVDCSSVPAHDDETSS